VDLPAGAFDPNGGGAAVDPAERSVRQGRAGDAEPAAVATDDAEPLRGAELGRVPGAQGDRAVGARTQPDRRARIDVGDQGGRRLGGLGQSRGGDGGGCPCGGGLLDDP
jgi:hypothetical protein